MKCIHCGNDCKYKERPSGHCPGCHKKFAFEPQNKDPFTDLAFKSAIDAVSANGQVRWGVEHLYYELCRRYKRRRFGWGIFLILAAGAAFLFLFILEKPEALILIPVGLVVWILLRRSQHPTTIALSQETFDSLWERWVKTHGYPTGVIQRKDQPQRKKPKEPDIADYSFDRVVICDRARTVDLLLANNFHFENNCAVLSVGGYPPGPFETVRAMVKRNPKLDIFALHDANVAGCKLAYMLAHNPEWFEGHPPVTDVGLRPRHAGPFQGLSLPATTMALMPGEGIAADEIAWLQNNSLELATIRPEQVLKRLYRAITHQADEEEADWDGVFYDSSSFGSDASDSEGGADSFG